MAFVPVRTPVPLVQQLVDRLEPYRVTHPEVPSLAQVQEILARVVGYPDAHAAQVAARKALIGRQDLPLLPGVSPRRLKDWASAARKAWPGPSAQALWARLWGHASWEGLVTRLLAAHAESCGFVVTADLEQTHHLLPGVRWVGQALDGQWWGVAPTRANCHALIQGPESQRLTLMNPWVTTAVAEGQTLMWWGLSLARARTVQAHLLAHAPTASVEIRDFSRPGQPQPSLAGFDVDALCQWQAQILRPVCRSLAPLSADREAFLWRHLVTYMEAAARALLSPGQTATLATLVALWQSPEAPVWAPVEASFRQQAHASVTPLRDLWRDQWVAIGQHWQTVLAWFDVSQVQAMPTSGVHTLWVGPADDGAEALTIRQGLMEWVWAARFPSRARPWAEEIFSPPASPPAKELWWMEGPAADDWPASLVAVRLAQARGMGVTWVWTVDAALRHRQLDLCEQASWQANVRTHVNLWSPPSPQGIQGELVVSHPHHVPLIRVGIAPGVHS